jgi:hypothetical protein
MIQAVRGITATLLAYGEFDDGEVCRGFIDLTRQ